MRLKGVRDSKKTSLSFSKLNWKWRSVLLIVFGGLFLSALVLASIAYGMHLNRYGQSVTFKRWALSLYHHKLSFIPNYLGSLRETPEQFQIDIKYIDFQKIIFKREEALKVGSLLVSEDDWVPARIRYQGEDYRVRLRLKGDRPDHWKRKDRWSYKIKVMDDKTLFGMKRFAIQDPRTRGYLDEWYLHQFLKELDLIHLRFDFVDVSINGKKEPIYTLEENFGKRLIENNKRREGPLFKINTDIRIQNRLDKTMFPLAVELYQMNRNIENKELLDQFNLAKSLLEGFRQGELTVDQVFDLKRMTTFFALIDLLGHHHANELNNLKFYFNPVTNKIEPVAYDNSAIIPLDQQGLLGDSKDIYASPSQNKDGIWVHYLLSDATFYSEYIRKLEMLSNETFLVDFFEKTQKEADRNLRILHKSYPWYHFENKETLFSNQKYIRDALKPRKMFQSYFSRLYPQENTLEIMVGNIYPMPIEIFGLFYQGKRIADPERVAFFQATKKGAPIIYQKIRFQLPAGFTWDLQKVSELEIQGRIFGSSFSMKDDIFPWLPTDKNLLRKETERNQFNFKDFDIFEINESEKTIVFKRGEWDLDRNLIIPGGYQVIVPAGTKIHLLNQANIVSYSPLRFQGTEEMPIWVDSPDGSGQGIVVLETKEASSFDWVQFENLANPSIGAWKLLGAVNFYEAAVRLNNCHFSKNRSEDSLNVIRSDFRIVNSHFSDVPYDAFDSDFSSGSVENSFFKNCKNDALDFSGSDVTVKNVQIESVGDKAISIGEASTAILENILVKDAFLGIANKDLSQAKITGFQIEKCEIGVAAFQKKPEFGPSKLEIYSLESENIKEPWLVEKGSFVFLENKALPAQEIGIADILYSKS